MTRDADRKEGEMVSLLLLFLLALSPEDKTAIEKAKNGDFDAAAVLITSTCDGSRTEPEIKELIIQLQASGDEVSQYTSRKILNCLRRTVLDKADRAAVEAGRAHSKNAVERKINEKLEATSSYTAQQVREGVRKHNGKTIIVRGGRPLGVLQRAGLLYGVGGGFIAVSALTFVGSLGIAAIAATTQTSAAGAVDSTSVASAVMLPALGGILLGAVEIAIGLALVSRANATLAGE